MTRTTTEPSPFGAMLQRLRRKAGLSQQELAERAGLSLRGIADLERGARRTPYPATVRRLVEALGLDDAARAALLAAAQPDTPASWPAQIEPTRSLPVPLSSFVGRERELTEVKRLLETARLLTLLGTGGIGKTRLALEVAREVKDQARHVVLVELAPVATPDLVAQSVASALGVREQPRRPLVATLAEALRTRSLLLVLDNCEHVVQMCAELADTLLRSCPDLRILATSREPLSITGEVIWPVPPLSLPTPHAGSALAELEPAESARLFIARARAVAPDFTPDEHNADAIAEICRRLDGLPLALELAAAKVAVLSAPQIAERLAHRFRLLTAGGRTAPARHQTLLAAINWSYDLLDERERKLFERLAAFAGGWDLTAAEHVCAGADLAADHVLDLLTGLAAKSMVMVTRDAVGTARYGMLETLREYAWGRLEARREAEMARRRHVAYFLELAEQASPWAFDADPALERLQREHDNLRAALRWAIDRQEVEWAQRLGAALGRLWFFRGHLSEGRAWLAALRMLPGAGRTRAHAEIAYRAGLLAWTQGKPAAAQPLLEESLEVARGVGATAEQAQALFGLGHVARTRGDYAAARGWYQQSVEVARAGGHRRQEVVALLGLGWVAAEAGEHAVARGWLEEVLEVSTHNGWSTIILQALAILSDVDRQQGDHQAARVRAEKALAFAREVGARWWIVSTATSLAQIALAQGDDELARGLLHESLGLARELGDQAGIARGLEVSLEIAAAVGEPERVVHLAAAAAALRAAAAAPLSAPERERLETRLTSARSTLGQAASEAAWRTGSGLSDQQAIACALAVGVSPDGVIRSPGQPAPRPNPVDVLTPRESEVVALVAQGLSNRQIAQSLVIAEATVIRHVSNILGKLSLTSRAQVAVWAMQHGVTPGRPAPMDSPL